MDLKQLYQQIFAGSVPRFVVRAPGRVNLIGEHTDYNGGFVLPIAMSQSLQVAVGAGDGHQILVHSNAFNETVSLPVDRASSESSPAWVNYVRGVAALLLKQGISLKPSRLLIHSEVPIGGGVSSSAALEIGTALALLALAGETLEPVPLALLAQQAEHQYADSPCGIMDQFICALGKAGHALLLDCRSQTYQHLPFRLDRTALVVMDTQIKHRIGSSEYPIRQKQCREGLAKLQQSYPEVNALRDVTKDMLDSAETKMDEVTFNRCRHVQTEIARTLEAADALRVGDLEIFGQFMYESHDSLRDDYEVSCDELDCLVEIARSIPGVYGARMTGGGFGGCAIALVRWDLLGKLRSTIRRQYDSRFENPAVVYTTTASDAAAVQKL
jgi:galactokinase